jgi:hypothetical protein
LNAGVWFRRGLLLIENSCLAGKTVPAVRQKIHLTNCPNLRDRLYAWNKLIDQPETITSIGMREWAHVGQN